jgi:hypothetical protein
MALQRDGGWTREVHVGFIDGPGFRVRGHQPEKGIGASEYALDDIGVAVRALNHFDAVADGLGQLRGIAYDDACRRARLKQVRQWQSSNLQSLHPACTCTESFWLQ